MSLKSGLIIKAGTSGTGQTAHWEMTVGGIDGRFWVHEKKIIPMGCVRGVRQLWRCQTTLKMVSKDTLKGILQVYYTTVTPFAVQSIYTLIRVSVASFWVSDTHNHSSVRHPKESNTTKGVKNIPKKGYDNLPTPFQVLSFIAAEHLWCPTLLKVSHWHLQKRGHQKQQQRTDTNKWCNHAIYHAFRESAKCESGVVFCKQIDIWSQKKT